MTMNALKWLVSLSLLASGASLTACKARPSYATEYAGDTPVHFTNRHTAELELTLRPAGAPDWGKEWGRGIRTATTTTYKVKPGRYDIRVFGMDQGVSSYGDAMNVDINGEMTFVVIPPELRPPANATAIVIHEARGNAGSGGGGNAPARSKADKPEKCKPIGAKVLSSDECCSGSAEFNTFRCKK